MLMINFTENLTKVKGLTLDSILPSKGKVKIRLALKNEFLNNTGIYYQSKNQILYKLKILKTLIFAKQYKISFFIHFLNLSVVTINFLKNNMVYKSKKPNLN